jgi:hypothetical protein
MSTTATRKGSDFVLPPAGTHLARCYSIIDLGTQKTTWQNQVSYKHQVHIRWELPGELMEAGEDGKQYPFSVGKTYTCSTDPKANLRHDLVSWAGREMTEEEVAGFMLEKLLGKVCQLTVIHEKSKSDPTKIYANIKAVTPLAKGSVCGDPVNPLVHYEIEMGKNDVYKSLSDYVQGKIAECDEWQQGADAPADSGEAPAPDDDNIPFHHRFRQQHTGHRHHAKPRRFCIV